MSQVERECLLCDHSRVVEVRNDKTIVATVLATPHSKNPIDAICKATLRYDSIEAESITTTVSRVLHDAHAVFHKVSSQLGAITISNGGVFNANHVYVGGGQS